MIVKRRSHITKSIWLDLLWSKLIPSRWRVVFARSANRTREDCMRSDAREVHHKRFSGTVRGIASEKRRGLHHRIAKHMCFRPPNSPCRSARGAEHNSVIKVTRLAKRSRGDTLVSLFFKSDGIRMYCLWEQPVLRVHGCRSSEAVVYSPSRRIQSNVYSFGSGYSVSQVPV